MWSPLPGPRSWKRWSSRSRAGRTSPSRDRRGAASPPSLTCFREVSTGPLAASSWPAEFPGRIAALRATIAGKILAFPTSPIVPFGRRMLLPGTIRDNLLGPSESNGAEQSESIVTVLFEQLQGVPLLETLVNLGQ